MMACRTQVLLLHCALVSHQSPQSLTAAGPVPCVHPQLLSPTLLSPQRVLRVLHQFGTRQSGNAGLISMLRSLAVSSPSVLLKPASSNWRPGASALLLCAKAAFRSFSLSLPGCDVSTLD